MDKELPPPSKIARSEGEGCTEPPMRKTEQAELDAENDSRIGWPDPLEREATTGTVLRLRLNGYRMESRDEILEALLTLARHGIGLEELSAGVAVGTELPPSKAAREVYVEERDQGVRPSKVADYFPPSTLVAVGRNFADFEVPPQIRKARAFTSEEGDQRSTETWPRQRVREMSRNGEGGNRIYRVFVGDFYDYDDERDLGKWHSVR